MYKPGITNESFQIMLASKPFGKGDILKSRTEYLLTLWTKFKHFLGCTPIYHCVVQDEPKKEGAFYVYTMKWDSKTIRIFGIKIKTVKHEK